MQHSLQLHELTLLEIPIRILLSVVISGIIGMERERKNRAAGLRTYTLVCMGSCIVMMTNQYVYQFLNTGDPVRMSAQVINGIGFLGAGTIIITKHSKIKGLTTAAGLWASVCLGLAVGIGFYEVAAIGAACVFVVLTLFHSWEKFVRRNARSIFVYIELKAEYTMKDFLEESRAHDFSASNIQFETNNGSSIAFVATITPNSKKHAASIFQEVCFLPVISYLEEL